MSDWLSKIRREQLELARKITDEIVPQELLQSKAAIDLSESNSWLFFKSKVGHEILLAIYGYTDWIACHIKRSNNFSAQFLPELSDEDTQHIAKIYDVRAEFLKALIARRLTRPGNILPLLGSIDSDGKLLPNEEILKKWAELYDWSKPEK